MLKKDTKSNDFLTYKEKPLVRKGNTLYYGDMNDKFVAKLDIKESKKENDLNLATRVVVHLLNTDPECDPKDQIVKSGEREGLYAAIDMAEVWLNKILENA